MRETKTALIRDKARLVAVAVIPVAAAKSYDWPRVIACFPSIRNSSTTPSGGSSLYAPLHQAAHGGAPAEIVHRLIGLGAWRTLQNVRGEQPVDIAERQRHSHLLGILAPDLKRRVS